MSTLHTRAIRRDWVELDPEGAPRTRGGDPFLQSIWPSNVSSPRTRGGDPVYRQVSPLTGESSPHTRG